MARLHHIAAEPEALMHELGLTPSQAVATDDLLRAAQELCLKAKDALLGQGAVPGLQAGAAGQQRTRVLELSVRTELVLLGSHGDGCLMVAGDTAPVREVRSQQQRGVLVSPVEANHVADGLRDAMCIGAIEPGLRRGMARQPLLRKRARPRPVFKRSLSMRRSTHPKGGF